MANIAVICEGVSEFNIINHIVSRYLGDHSLNAVQPKINNDTQADEGGWSRVLDHCKDDDIEPIFQLNDYLIIQIDTDTSHISPYDIPHNFKDGSAKSPRRLHAEIKARLMRELSSDIRKKYIHRIIFAICHNEIECWHHLYSLPPVTPHLYLRAPVDRILCGIIKEELNIMPIKEILRQYVTFVTHCSYLG